MKELKRRNEVGKKEALKNEECKGSIQQGGMSRYDEDGRGKKNQ